MMQRDQASAMLGMVVEHDAPGESRVSMTVRDDMLNGFAITHGGLVFTLADTAFAIACNEDERVTVAGGADITFLKSTTVGQTLTATAARRARSGRTGLYDIRVTDETGDLVAEVRGRSITTDRRPPADASSAIRATSVRHAEAAAEDVRIGEDARGAARPSAGGSHDASSAIRATSAPRAGVAAEDVQITDEAQGTGHGSAHAPVPSTGSGTPATDPAPERNAALTTTEVSR
ncbi:hydroxyphenylacetyl-CoA thioesterase PaaI [Microbacterium testaceum]|uniref:hydroxyphenylacetyl-CoA thioesterase PaaI n=1 Tax=Microbacterium testaceum TaxID=2033 RepID=UPI00380E9A62